MAEGCGRARGAGIVRDRRAGSDLSGEPFTAMDGPTALGRPRQQRPVCSAQSPGVVSVSRMRSQVSACSRVAPHISADGRSPAQKAGRSGRPKIRHALSSSSWTQRSPARLPCGMPGMGEVMEGAMQHAPQEGRQFIERVPGASVHPGGALPRALSSWAPAGACAGRPASRTARARVGSPRPRPPGRCRSPGSGRPPVRHTPTWARSGRRPGSGT